MNIPKVKNFLELRAKEIENLSTKISQVCQRCIFSVQRTFLGFTGKRETGFSKLSNHGRKKLRQHHEKVHQLIPIDIYEPQVETWANWDVNNCSWNVLVIQRKIEKKVGEKRVAGGTLSTVFQSNLNWVLLRCLCKFKSEKCFRFGDRSSFEAINSHKRSNLNTREISLPPTKINLAKFFANRNGPQTHTH